MYWTKATALAACATLASAHGGSGHEHLIPRIAGDARAIADLIGRDGALTQMHNLQSRGAGLERRQSANPERCGEGVGKCQEGYCCSSAGWCGNTETYCWAPDCQINFGDGCDGNQKPKGKDTSDVKRPKLGKVPYGPEIYNCARNGDIAITYDDGPFLYTGDLLDIFKKFGAKATFFMNGNNKGKGHINDPTKQWADMIKRMAAEGHQVASHSWSHQNYTQLTQEQFRNQLIWNEIAINDILGYFPTYYRPPYSICPDTCKKTLEELGYHNVHFVLDTNGLANDDPLKIGQSKAIWDDAMNANSACNQSYIHIEHDLQVQTVYNLTAYMLESLYKKGYRSVTVGECLGDPAENWYRSGSGAPLPKYSFPVKENVCDGSSPPSMTFTYGAYFFQSR
ncbi:uncharacterized protein B0I36DRAFT_313860 [Microdochium trichocladiopsis]|uniref:Glycoside hydrolase/deacetylase n=1 Tax=Microdochium trichocladiopsis TaxID=1682393 RepID=A0A9P8YDI9_9PEZI|nr:uncharacterized protein B0I36DRAFT_313860 [Microdochium trichocladiopsis]KAH7037353.1 hypothetical protein B0I36DRAFT_313860 [Microdochium trichocladiopsis]